MTQDLRERVSKLEEELAVQEEIIKSLTLPPLRKGIISEVFDKKVEVIVGKDTYEVSYNPRIKDQLKKGKSVSLNNSYAIVDVSDPRKEGNVVLVMAINRSDMIDPAVLRPGRVDRKLEIPRPNDKGAKQIYDIYLKDMPFSKELRRAAKKAGFPDVDYLSSECVKKLFSDESMLALMEFYDNTSEPVRYKNLVSGAIIEASVQRATDYAIKREIGNGNGKGKGNGHDTGLGLSDLIRAIDAEFKEMGQSVKRLLTESDMRSIADGCYDQIKDIKSII